MVESIRTPYQLTEHVKFVQKTTLVFDGRVLILKRGPQENTRRNCWDLPGGNVNWPKNLKKPVLDPHKQDAVREVREESGIIIDESELVADNISHFETYFEPDEETYKIYCGWQVELPSDFDPNSIQISNEHTEFAWVNIDELDKYDFGGEAGQFIVKQIKNSLKKHE